MTNPTRGAQVKGDQRDQLRKRAVEAYLAGSSIESTGRQIGRSYGAARTLLIEAGVKLRPRGRAR
ncbi:helix-turn-helix domain-containing protein [Streptomyces chartreusis]|uniref:helix-turn-helix domain-containing protein n=1 Tax=Streptomyces chartreusis TaxID=1969 RepID=UPI0038303D1E